MSDQDDQQDIWQNELLTVKDMAAFLQASRVSALRWCRPGIIPAFCIGRHWRIRRDKLLELGGSLIRNRIPKRNRIPGRLGLLLR